MGYSYCAPCCEPPDEFLPKQNLKPITNLVITNAKMTGIPTEILND